jgi:preprotein translocase subunit SecG
MGMLAQMAWGQWFLAVMLIGVCCFLMLVILLQRGRGGGLTGAFGGAGGSSAFGAKTGDVFTWITVVVTALFLVLAVTANFVFDESAPARASTPELDLPAAPTPLPEGVVPSDSVPGAPGSEGLLLPPGETFPAQGDATGQPTADEAEPGADETRDTGMGDDSPAESDDGSEE